MNSECIVYVHMKWMRDMRKYIYNIIKYTNRINQTEIMEKC